MRSCKREDFEKYGQGEIFDEHNSGSDKKDMLICFAEEHATTKL